MGTTLGKRLKQCREDAGLTQQKLAHELGVSIGTVVRVENGREPELSTVVRAADLFDQSLDWLVRGRGVQRRRRPARHEAAE